MDRAATLASTAALRAESRALKSKGLHRSLFGITSPRGATFVAGRRRLVNFGSNDYLGSGTDPAVARAAADACRRWGTGSGASRLLSGNLALHVSLERRLAAFKGEEAATVFSSGYLANLGALTALAGEGDLVVLDRLNHASLVDGARLSRAKLWVYPHRDAAALDALLARASGFRRKLVATDAYFSMDGDTAPLDRLLEVSRKHGALLVVDEAHSTGVFGPRGRGLAEAFRLEGKIDVVMGTLSKALGSVGGFIAGSRALKDHLTNRARTFIYTTAPAPAASAAALACLGWITKDPAPRERLWRNIRVLREALREAGIPVLESEGPVIPVPVPSPAEGARLQASLAKEGLYVPLIRTPSVPRGAERLRVSVTAAHERAHLDALVRTLKPRRKRSTR